MKEKRVISDDNLKEIKEKLLKSNIRKLEELRREQNRMNNQRFEAYIKDLEQQLNELCRQN